MRKRVLYKGAGFFVYGLQVSSYLLNRIRSISPSGRKAKAILAAPLLLIGMWPAASPPALAASYYAAPGGSPGGDGSPNRPWDLATALSSKYGEARAGDTVWLMEGTYRGNFYSSLQGTESVPVIVRAQSGERVTLDGTLVQADGGYVTFWGFEIMRSYSDHQSSQAGSAPTDLPVIMGMNVKAPGIRLVNMIIHDQVSNGAGVWEEAPNAELYGCLFYYNGWDGTDRGHGHGMYIQNRSGFKRIADNISFGNYSDCLQIYGTGNAHLDNITVEGNVFFNAGNISRWDGANELQLGGGSPAHNIVVRQNHVYSSDGNGRVNIGSEASNVGVKVENNVIVGRLRLQNWSSISLQNNEIAARSTFLEWVQNSPGISAVNTSWDRNDYYSQEIQWEPLSLVTSTSRALDFGKWKSLTGVDRNSTYVKGKPSGVQVFVRRNAYESGRGHVVVYNWERRAQVAVDVGNILAQGAQFEVRNAQNYFGSPVLRGTYQGQDLVLPMSGLPVARPMGKSTAPAPTGPEFNVFVILTSGQGSVSQPPDSPLPPSSSGQSYAQTQGIDLPDYGPASVYPSRLSVSGLPGVIRKVTVTLVNLSHSYPDDLDFLLVSPSGKKALIMSDAGGGDAVDSISLVLNDSGQALPDYQPLRSSTYRPGNYGNGDTFDAPAPDVPYAYSLSAFNGDSPNGTWALYIRDDERYDQGRLAGGWRLNLETGSSAGVESISPDFPVFADTSTEESDAPGKDSIPSVFQPAIRSVQIRPGEPAVLLIHWTPGQTYEVETSSDNIIWTPLARAVAVTKVQEFADLETPPDTLRFYRLRQVPLELWQQKEQQPETVEGLR